MWLCWCFVEDGALYMMSIIWIILESPWNTVLCMVLFRWVSFETKESSNKMEHLVEYHSLHRFPPSRDYSRIYLVSWPLLCVRWLHRFNPEHHVPSPKPLSLVVLSQSLCVCVTQFGRCWIFMDETKSQATYGHGFSEDAWGPLGTDLRLRFYRTYMPPLSFFIYIFLLYKFILFYYFIAFMILSFVFL